MRKIGLIFSTLFFLLLECGVAFASSPPYPGPIEVRQPDGTVFFAKLVGGKGSSAMQTMDGYAISKDASGYWVYAVVSEGKITQTSFIVGVHDPLVEGIPKHPLSVRPFAASPAFWKMKLWGGNIDRVGVFDDPRFPVAWKGEKPLLSWVWTGTEWLLVAVLEGKTLSEQISFSLPMIEKKLDKKMKKWEWADENYLRAIIEEWGYIWAGTLKKNK